MTQRIATMDTLIGRLARLRLAFARRAQAESSFTSTAGYEAMMAWYATCEEHASVPVESLTVPTRYGETHLLAAGPADAPPVVLLHGTEGTALSWRYQLRDLAADFRLYALDIIGSAGKSASARPSYVGPAYAEWLAEVLDGLGLERASFAGMSNGAWLIVKLAGLDSRLVAGAVLISVNGLAPIRPFYHVTHLMEWGAIRIPLGAIAGRVLTRKRVRAVMAAATPPGVEIDPDEVEWFYLLARHYRFRFPPPPLRDDELKKLAAPALVLMGEHDQFYSVRAVIRRAQALLPDLRAAEVISGVGHNLAMERPALVNARLRRFFERGG
jgi:pimeloyl-ACP methyl ester carboxylesterase